jgi:hypothetical protein
MISRFDRSGGRRGGRPATMTGAVMAVAMLAACSSTGGGPASGLFAGGAGGGDSKAAQPKFTAADFAKDTYCPPVYLRDGTESLSLYERGRDGEADQVRFQASIAKTARECRLVGDTLSVKLGVSGRVIAGPKGSAGTVTLPLRIAVTKQMGGDKAPLYSKLFKISVPVAPPDFGANYSQVFDQVAFKVGPEDRDLIIYVGFDEGKKT